VSDNVLSDSALRPAYSVDLTNTTSDILGGGGCTAVALAAIGKLGTTKEEVAAKLNAHIDHVQLELGIEDRRRVGAEGDY
jgi:hypothetical protein